MTFLAFIWPTLAVLNRRIFAGLRLSVLPVLAALGIWLVGRLYSGAIGTSALAIIGFLLLELLLLCFCYAWFAIRWHRLLLLNEPQSAIGGRFPPRALRRYALRLFALGTGFLLATLFIKILTNALWVHGMLGEWIRYVLLYLFFGWLFHRLSPALASVPLGDPLSRRDAWRATRGTDVQCLGLAFGTLLISTALAFPLTPDGSEITAFEPLYMVVAFWVQVLVFTTSITVVYQRTVRHPSVRQ